MLGANKVLAVVIRLVIAWIIPGELMAAGISATYTSTPSVCYNDGSLTVTATGGTGPYTYSITSGPSNPNINYPITVPPGVSTFGSLPAGTFTVLITDASGNTATVSCTVGGSYQFPTLSFNTTAVQGAIIATETGGLAPYSYAISSTGSNTGFGPFQSSDTFSHLCPGDYWIRVSDSCGNIYTDEVIFAQHISDTILCINYSKGSLSVTASGGTPPYTYSIGGMTNTTGSFSGLNSYFSDSLVITDACGDQYAAYLSPPVFSLFEPCPSDGTLYSTGIIPPIYPTTLTFDCLNCVPPQTITVPYNGPPQATFDSLFSNQPPGINFDIVILSSACGGDTIKHTPVSKASNVAMSLTYLSCRSFVTVVSAGGAPVVADSFVLSYVAHGPTIQSNTSGLFEQLPDSQYVVTAYIGALCGDTPTANASIPHFGSGCFTLMKDSACQNVWEYSVNSVTPELYTLLISPGDTMTASTNPVYNANFYGLTSDTSYILISDSGCTEDIKAPPPVMSVPAVIAFLPCVGSPVIQITAPDFTYCGGSTTAGTSEIRVTVTYGGVQIYDGSQATGNPVQINITDSGWYHYAIYPTNTLDTSSQLRFDTLCPIDTGQVYMNNTVIPYLTSTVALVCDTSSVIDTVYYQVYGGSPPYTVQVPGYDTITLAGNTGIFPSHRAGTYTMYVYDNCGISRSITFTVVDTCSGCPYGAIYLPDTFSCAGDTIRLTSQSVQAASFRWIVNGQLYSTAKDTSFASAAGGNTIMLIVISSTGCADTAIAHTSDTCNGCAYVAVSLPDTLYCVSDTALLRDVTIGAISYQWLVNGQAYSTAPDTTLIPTTGENTITLRITSASGCVDSAVASLTGVAPYTLDLGPDTTYCGSFTAVLSTGISTTVWSTGSSGSQITVGAPGTYTAQASNICGTAIDSIVLSENPIPIVSLGDDTSLCKGTEITLDAGHPGATYEWDDSTTGETLTVSQTGTYTVSVTVAGCTGEGSVVVTIINAPQPFDLGGDTTICRGYPLLLEAYQPNAYSIWNTGSTSSFIYVTESGKYVVLDSNKCGEASDSISVTVEDCSCRVQIPTAFSPNNDGHNDLYGGIAWCVPLNYVLEIYDRWGQKLFTSYSISDKWNGTYDNKPQPLGVYVYYMRYTDPYTSIDYSQSGNVTLIR